MSPIVTRAAIATLALAAGSAFAVPGVIDTDTYAGHTYKLLSADTWTASEDYAVSALGAHLVTVNDAAENDWLIARFGSSSSLWIGLRRTAPHASTFAWANGEAVSYTNWSSGEPNDCGACIGDPDGEQFTHTYTSGLWNDLGNFSDYSGAKYGVVEIAGVPEPGSSTLLLAGAGMLGLLARRRSR